MSSEASVILEGRLDSFFQGEIVSAKENLGLELSGYTDQYLVQLLVDYSARGDRPEPGGEPLAFLYKKALESQDADRIRHLKDLGDLALYVAGFFVESIERSLVDIDYYVGMGGSAYASLSDMMGATRRGAAFAEIYDELATGFSGVVDILNEISGKKRASRGDVDLLKLYDRWMRTGSDRIRKQLVDEGLVPTKGSTEYIQ